jgi:hypothetical protein
MAEEWKNLDEWLALSDSRETSPEIMQAIWIAAGGDWVRAEYIWSHGPKKDVYDALIKQFNWRAAGYDWINS